jgi:hypothetical protein
VLFAAEAVQRSEVLPMLAPDIVVQAIREIVHAVRR